jgi:large subunit ribosomal protein L4
LKLDAIKTKDVANPLQHSDAPARRFLLFSLRKNDVIKSARNIAGAKTALVNTFNTYDILNCDKMVMFLRTACQAKIEEVYA